jgi:hypothetical protein
MAAERILRVNTTVQMAAEQADGGNTVVTAPSMLVGYCPAPSPSMSGRQWAGSLIGSSPRIDFRS